MPTGLTSVLPASHERQRPEIGDAPAQDVRNNAEDDPARWTPLDRRDIAKNTTAPGTPTRSHDAALPRVSNPLTLPFDPIAEAQRQWAAHSWADAAEGMAAVTSIMGAHQIMHARVDEMLRPLDLTFARYELLMLLHFSKRGSVPVAKASQRLQVHPSNVTSGVDRLEAAGLVRKTPHPTDGRTVLVEITNHDRCAGLAATNRLNRDVFAESGLRPRRLAVLLSALAEFRRRAGDFT